VKNLFRGGARNESGEDAKRSGEGKDNIPDLEDAKDIKHNDDGTSIEEKNWGDLDASERKIAKDKIREEMRRKIEEKYAKDKKIDARIAEMKKDKLDSDEPDRPYKVGPGSADFCIGAWELAKGILFGVLFVVGILIAISSPSLNSCGSVTTNEDISFCVATILNTTIDGASQRVQCTGVGSTPTGVSTGCCETSADLAKSVTERQACIYVIETQTQTCLSQSEFEDICKDETSCPDSIVSTYANALVAFSFSLLGFALIMSLRGYGLTSSFATIHYVEFFESRLSSFGKLTLCMSKSGVWFTQWLFIVYHVPAVTWLLYYDQYLVPGSCSNAEATDGSAWMLPVDIAFFLGFTLAIEGILLILSSLVRYQNPVRAELYRPVVNGSQSCSCCGILLDCRSCRGRDFYESSNWLGSECYIGMQRSIKSLFPKRCRGFYKIIWNPVRLINMALNCMFWLSIGLVGALLEKFAKYKHFISL